MAVKKIIDIEVNDAAFQRFVGLFNKYQEQLNRTPDAWKKVSDEAGEAIGKTTDGVEQTAEQTERLEKAAAGTHVQFSQMFVQIAGAGKDMDQAGKTQASYWRDIARHARGFAVSITDATRSLLRWASITGVISGLLGAGGLFGIARLATSAGESRRSALGLGVTPGEQKAFSLNYGRVVDPDRFLGGVNEALHDVTKRVAFTGAGLTNKDLEGKDSAQIASDLIPALKKIADQTPDAMMAQVLRARRLDQFIDIQDFQRLKNTPASELDSYKARYNEDMKTLDLTREQQKAWQNLQVQLSRAGTQLENVLVKGLTKLIPEIEGLSAAFSKAVADLLGSQQIKEWIGDLAKGIKWLADEIQSTAFKDGMIEFGRNIIELATMLKDAAHYIKSWFEPEEKSDLQKAAEDAGWGWDPFLQQPTRLPTTPPGPMPTPPGYEVDPYTGGFVHKGDPSFGDRFRRFMDKVLPGGLNRGNPDPNYQPFPNLEGGSVGFLGNLDQKYNLPTGFLDAVWNAESGRGMAMHSPKGAEGHFQFMPDTARQWGVNNPDDLEDSARGAGRFFNHLMSVYNQDKEKVLAAWNWGPSKLDEDIKVYHERWKEHIPNETADFIAKVLGALPKTQQPVVSGSPIKVSMMIRNNTGGSAIASASQLA